MPSVRLRKMKRDLWSSPARTTLVVLSIAIGVIAVGVIATTRIVLLRELHIAGLAHDVIQPAPTISGQPVGYITPKTLA